MAKPPSTNRQAPDKGKSLLTLSPLSEACFQEGIGEDHQMNTQPTQHQHRAFALKELLILLSVFSLVALVGVQELSQARHRSQRICCNCNLKQIGLAFRSLEIDHSHCFPMSRCTNLGGTWEYVAT